MSFRGGFFPTAKASVYRVIAPVGFLYPSAACECGAIWSRRLLCDMHPLLPAYYFAYLLTTDTVLLHQQAAGYSVHVSVPDFDYLTFSQFTGASLLACVSPSLRPTIGYVISLSPDK